MLNRWSGIGNATANPEMKYTPANVAYVQFNVACNRPFANANGEKETDFIFVVAWKELAEVVVNYLRSGRKIYVEGRLQVRSYDDDQGVKRYITEIVAEKIDFLDSPPDDVKNQNGQQGQATRGNQNQGNNQGNRSQSNNRNYQNQGSNSQGSRSQGSYQAKNNQSYNRNQGNNASGSQSANQGNRSQGGNNRNYQNQGSGQGNQPANSNGRMPWE